MFKPIKDIFKYVKIFELYLGKKMYLIFTLSILASLFEGIGILMLLQFHWVLAQVLIVFLVIID